MDPVERHELAPDVSFDGGDLDCGNGLLLLIRRHIDPLPRGGLLEIQSREISVDEDLPAWCRLTGNELVSWTRQGKQRSFLVCKGQLAERGHAWPGVVRDCPERLSGACQKRQSGGLRGRRGESFRARRSVARGCGRKCARRALFARCTARARHLDR